MKYTILTEAETLLDLLELYTNYRNQTEIGPQFTIDAFLSARIPLNEELSARGLPRFTEWRRTPQSHNGLGQNGMANGTTTVNGTHNRINNKNTSPKDTLASPSTNSSGGVSASTAPTSVPGGRAANNAIRQRLGERGRDGTVRFMLNPDREMEERAVIAEYGPEGGKGPAA